MDAPEFKNGLMEDLSEEEPSVSMIAIAEPATFATKNAPMEDTSEPSVDHLTAASLGLTLDNEEPKAVDSSEEEIEDSKAAAWKEEPAVSMIAIEEPATFAAKKKEPSSTAVASKDNMNGSSNSFGEDVSDNSKKVRPSDKKVKTAPAMRPGAVAVKNDETEASAPSPRSGKGKMAVVPAMVPGAVAMSNDDAKPGASAVSSLETVDNRVAAKMRGGATNGASKPGAQAETAVGSSAVARARQTRYENKMRDESNHSNGGDDKSALSSSQTSQPGVTQSNVGHRGLRKDSRTKEARSKTEEISEELEYPGSQPDGSRVVTSKSEDHVVSEKMKAFNMGGVEGMEEHFLSKNPGASQSQVWRDNLKIEESEKANLGPGGLGGVRGMSESMLNQSKLNEESYDHGTNLIEATLVQDDPEGGRGGMMDHSDLMIAEAVKEQEGVFMTKKKMYGMCFLLVAILGLSIGIPCGLGACSDSPPPPETETYCSLDNYTLWLVDKPDNDEEPTRAWIPNRPGSDDPWTLQEGDVICTSDILPWRFNIEALVTCEPAANVVQFHYRAGQGSDKDPENYPPHNDRGESGWPYFSHGNYHSNYSWIFGEPLRIVGNHSITTGIYWVGETIWTTVNFTVIDCTECDTCGNVQVNGTTLDMNMTGTNMTNMTDFSEFVYGGKYGEYDLRSPEPDCDKCEERQELYFL